MLSLGDELSDFSWLPQELKEIVTFSSVNGLLCLRNHVDGYARADSGWACGEDPKSLPVS